ncbi:hypothetical protein F4802DRAFT_401084 [Xylaria palmicola]|nr:hypothetical protein F4802DRAFT_401084 [Xylaria palmicola]
MTCILPPVHPSYPYPTAVLSLLSLQVASNCVQLEIVPHNRKTTHNSPVSTLTYYYTHLDSSLLLGVRKGREACPVISADQTLARHVSKHQSVQVVPSD